jgi:hypothetical protein
VAVEDAQEPDDDDREPRYWLLGREAARSAAWVHARASLGALEKVLERVGCNGGLLDVRVAPWGGWPMMRVEVLAKMAVRIAELLSGLSKMGGATSEEALAAQTEAFGADASAWMPRRFDDFDAADANPGWYRLRPDTNYLAALRQAYAASEMLDALIRPVLLAGPMSVKPDAWEDGRAVVRIALCPDDAVRLTALLTYIADRTVDNIRQKPVTRLGWCSGGSR